MRSVGFFQGLRGAKAPYLRRSCPRLQNFSSGAARALIYLRRVLQGLRKIRRALVRLRNMSTAVARASKNRRGGLPGVGASVFPKASERTPKCLRRSWPHLQNFSSGPARAARYLQRALQGLPKIRRALHRPRNILLCNCEKSRAERASRKSRAASDFSKGRRLHIFAAELPAPSKLQGCASFDISSTEPGLSNFDNIRFSPCPEGDRAAEKIAHRRTA